MDSFPRKFSQECLLLNFEYNLVVIPNFEDGTSNLLKIQEISYATISRLNIFLDKPEQLITPKSRKTAIDPKIFIFIISIYCCVNGKTKQLFETNSYLIPACKINS